MRKRIVWATILVFLLCCLQPGVPGRAYACSCAGPQTVQDAVNGADAVFSGRVVSVTPINQNAAGGIYSRNPPSNEVVFSVTSVWKGVLRPQVTLATGTGGGDCGYVFTPGDTYIVYAYSSHPGSPVFSIGEFTIEIPVGTQQFDTSICTRTAPLVAAATDLAQLGLGAQPTQNDLMRLILDNLLAVVAGIAALIIAIILYLLRRGRRRRTFRLKP